MIACRGSRRKGVFAVNELVFLNEVLVRALRDTVTEATTENLRRAQLEGFQFCSAEQGFPVCAHSGQGAVDGWLLALSPESVRRIAAFHTIFDAEVEAVEVTTTQGPEQALAYVVSAETIDDCTGAYNPDHTPENVAVLSRAAAEMLMLASTHPTQALRARWPMALAHAASVERAKHEVDASVLRAPWTRDDVISVTEQQPYAWFFGVREDDLRFGQFDGAMGPLAKRAAFVMSDAVTVLPYDPKRDTVMVIEQFRFGPWLRGAKNCWLLEPIAGRVDPFETPLDAALREAQEEARLSLDTDQLLPVGNVYPSPGAITEFLYQFVALCDLPDGVEGVAGLEGEAENIRSHVVPFQRLMDLIRTGEVQNGPLVLTAYWLDAYRARNRA